MSPFAEQSKFELREDSIGVLMRKGGMVLEIILLGDSPGSFITASVPNSNLFIWK